jgi:hypothetical protein
MSEARLATGRWRDPTADVVRKAGLPPPRARLTARRTRRHA